MSVTPPREEIDFEQPGSGSLLTLLILTSDCCSLTSEAGMLLIPKAVRIYVGTRNQMVDGLSQHPASTSR